jgi:hypothetical protein
MTYISILRLLQITTFIFVIKYAYTKQLELNYTNPHWTDNDVTGTGFKLKDSAYLSLCKLLNCTTGCCMGSINQMRCGSKVQCDFIYYQTSFFKNYFINYIFLHCLLLIVFTSLGYYISLNYDCRRCRRYPKVNYQQFDKKPERDSRELDVIEESTKEEQKEYADLNATERSV